MQTWLSDPLSDPLAQRLTGALLHFVWQGTLLAALLAVALRFCRARSPNVRYVLCLATLGVMGLCPFITASLISPTATDAVGPAAVREMPREVPTLAASATWGTLPASRSLPSTLTESATPMLAGLARYQPFVLVAWCLGVALLSMRLMAAWVHSLWLRGGQKFLPPQVAVRARRLGRNLGLHTLRIGGSRRVGEAMAVGLFRPIVLLPVSWVAELPPDVLDAVIAHELAHIRRHDLWIVLAQRVLETLLFYHPAVWWVSRRISLEREMCCDELAVRATGQRLVYARALEAVGRRIAYEGKLTLVAPVSGESRMNLLTRVRSVLGLKSERDSAAWPAGLLFVIVALGLIGWSFSTSRADDDDPKREREEQVAKDGDREKPEAREEREEKDDERPAVKKEREEREERPVKNVAREEEDDDRPTKKEVREERDVDEERPAKKVAREEEDDDRPAKKEVRKEGDFKSADKEFKKEIVKETVKEKAFHPETEREKHLFAIIRKLEMEIARLQKEVARTSTGHVDIPKKGHRDGDGVKKGPRDGEGPVKKGPRDGDVVKKGPRDGDAPVKKGPREGDAPVKKGPREGDAEKPVKKGPPEGEKPRKVREEE